MKYLVLFLLLIGASGCTTLSEDVRLVTKSNKDTAELLVLREGAFQAGAVSMYVGKNNQYFMKLRNDQYGEVRIDSGTYTLQAKADASPASELEITLLPQEKTCLVGRPNPDMLGAVIVPLVANMVPTFKLEKVECPTDEKLSHYKNVGLQQ